MCFVENAQQACEEVLLHSRKKTSTNKIHTASQHCMLEPSAINCHTSYQQHYAQKLTF